ncbi:MAG: hypothetical protein RL135_1105 [Bacteroidota bacterium]
MILKFIRIEELSTRLVGFYTVQVEGEVLSEFEKFDAKTFSENQKDFDRIYSILLRMGEREAKPYYFRTENGANAIPGLRDVSNEEIEKSPDYGIRLYCVRLTNNLVILLNGDVKTHLKPKQCPNVRKHFDFAIRFSTLIDKAKFDKIIQWDPDKTWIIPNNEYIEI